MVQESPHPKQSFKLVNSSGQVSLLTCPYIAAGLGHLAGLGGTNSVSPWSRSLRADDKATGERFAPLSPVVPLALRSKKVSTINRSVFRGLPKLLSTQLSVVVTSDCCYFPIVFYKMTVP